MEREFFFEPEDEYLEDKKIFEDSGVIKLFRKYIFYGDVKRARIELEGPSEEELRTSIKLIFNEYESEDIIFYNFCRLYINPNSKKIEGLFNKEISDINGYINKIIDHPDNSICLIKKNNRRGEYPY